MKNVNKTFRSNVNCTVHSCGAEVDEEDYDEDAAPGDDDEEDVDEDDEDEDGEEGEEEDDVSGEVRIEDR